VFPVNDRRYRIWEFARRLWVKVVEDDVFFMASAVAFNLLVAMLPLILLGIGVTGYVLSAEVRDPVEAIVTLAVGVLPESSLGADPSEILRGIVAGVLEQRSGFTLLGAFFFVWLSTRLVGTLRVSLRDIFDIAQTRGIIQGKIFDIQVVIVGVLLVTLNLGVVVGLETAVRFGVNILGLGGTALSTAEWLLGQTVAVAAIWTLFLMMYRYLPARRIPWRTAMVAATFTAVCHEALKHGFSWYATEVADYTSTWGNLATVAILFFWIYYEALVFILGGEVGQVYTMRKAAKVQSGMTLGVNG
jgi:membrane protein